VECTDIGTAHSRHIVLLFLGWRIWKPRATSAKVQAIAVLPLANLSGDSSQDYLADGVTDELITELAQATGVLVISRTSSMLYKDKKKSMPQIAHELGVDCGGGRHPPSNWRPSQDDASPGSRSH